MLEEFQDYHAAEKPDGRDWMECNAFVALVPIAYVAAVIIAVAVATIVPEDVAPQAGPGVNAASR